MEILACPNLAVPAQVMRHVVHVESSANPFAIGVVGAQLVPVLTTPFTVQKPFCAWSALTRKAI